MADMFLVIIIIFALNPPFLYKIIRPQIPTIVSFFSRQICVSGFPAKIALVYHFLLQEKETKFLLARVSFDIGIWVLAREKSRANFFPAVFPPKIIQYRKISKKKIKIFGAKESRYRDLVFNT